MTDDEAYCKWQIIPAEGEGGGGGGEEQLIVNYEENRVCQKCVAS